MRHKADSLSTSSWSAFEDPIRVYANIPRSIILSTLRRSACMGAISDGRELRLHSRAQDFATIPTIFLDPRFFRVRLCSVALRPGTAPR
jgi:hypothetical protein